jgi:hypothetical protein
VPFILGQPVDANSPFLETPPGIGRGRDLTMGKLLALSRLPLTWHQQQSVFGFT